LVLLRVGFALPARLLVRRCALTAPFHPYRGVAAEAVCFLWHFPSTGLESGVPDVIRHTALRSSDFPLPMPEGTGSDLTLVCNSLRPKSRNVMGLAPAMEKSLSEELTLRRQRSMHCCIHAASPVRLTTTGLSAELYPFRSPLLRVSLLVSFPPLIYMLKFSG